MSRMLTSSIVAGVWSLVVFSGSPGGFAQAPPGTAEVRQPRPQNAALQVQNLSPELERLLKGWSENSAKIQKLQGTHQRFVYDTVFNVEKRAVGVFYYEAPGKGRIDLKPAPIDKNDQSKRVDKDKNPFKLQPDRAERWVCNGQDIWQINDLTKQVDVFPIPQENQGQNIMDGPMPFLFGMPPEKAKRRYQLALVNDPNLPENFVRLRVLPRLQVDAANWQKAEVILDTQQYLPRAVNLTDPSGNLETTYIFGNLKPNAPDPGWLAQVFDKADKDPFRPALKDFRFKVHKFEEEEDAPQAQGPFVPSVAGMGYKDAKALLEKLGCQVNLLKGEKAPDEKFNFVVYAQNPAAKTPLQKGQVVSLTLYDQVPERPVQPAQVQPAQGQVPPVLGLFWKDAGAKLEQAGYQVKYLPGKAASAKEKVYLVYEQAPNAGQPLKPGSEVTLTVYNKVTETPN